MFFALICFGRSWRSKLPAFLVACAVTESSGKLKDIHSLPRVVVAREYRYIVPWPCDLRRVVSAFRPRRPVCGVIVCCVFMGGSHEQRRHLAARAPGTKESPQQSVSTRRPAPPGKPLLRFSVARPG